MAVGQPGAYTAIIACRDDDAYLADAIASVLAQTLAPAELMVVLNPTSAADSPASHVARSFGPSVRVLEASAQGLIPGLNAGIHSTKTEFVAFLDSDDLWEPNKQVRQIEALVADPSLDASTSMATNFRDAPDGTTANLVTASAIMFTATTFRASAFRRFGMIDDGATHHTWLARWWSAAREQGIRTSCIGTVGLRRRIHSENSWALESATAHQELRNELRSILARKRAKML